MNWVHPEYTTSETRHKMRLGVEYRLQTHTGDTETCGLSRFQTSHPEGAFQPCLHRDQQCLAPGCLLK